MIIKLIQRIFNSIYGQMPNLAGVTFSNSGKAKVDLSRTKKVDV